jgi:hypothetical protein
MDTGKFAAQVGVFGGVLTYGVTGGISAADWLPMGEEVWHAIRIAGSLGIGIAVLDLPIVTRLVLRSRFVGGWYEGTSLSNVNPDDTPAREIFKLEHTRTEVKIHGVTVRNGAWHTGWHGTLSTERDRVHTFSITLDKGSHRELGIMELDIDEGRAQGTYLSTFMEQGKLATHEPPFELGPAGQSRTWSMQAKRADRDRAKELKREWDDLAH